MGTPVPSRSDVPDSFKWNAQSVFTDIPSWEEEYHQITEALAKDQISIPTEIKTAKELYSTFESSFDWLIRVKKVFLYAGLEHSVDTSQADAAQRYSQARGLLSQVQSRLAALQPLVLQIGEETINTWLEDDVDLSVYKHYFEDIFRKRNHIRSDEIETLLGLLRDPFAGTSATARMLTNADFQFEPAVSETGDHIDITQGSHPRLMTDPDRSIRRSAWENYLDLYLAHQNTLATTLETSIKQNVLLAHVRGYESSLEASLFEYQIPSEIFHNLLKAFIEKIPLWHRYWRIRRDALDLDPLRPFDTWAPLTPTQPHVPYEQAVEWICAGLEPMGEEYTAAIRRGCSEERWVDVYPNRGKRGGAFSSGVHGTFPFIVMSYNDTLFSLSTLAHELGHSMHSYLAWKHQLPVYSDYSLFVAEVASNFHQAMVRAYLLDQQTDPHFRIAVIEEAMANFYRYFLIMPTLARFELEIHQRVENGYGLTADLLKELCASLFEEAYGPNIHFDPDRVGMLWATFGHLYVDYYVYQYATGIAGAYAISRKILSGDQAAVNAYLEFLQLGGASYSIEALQAAGVDLTTPHPVHAAFEGMESMIDELEEIIQDIRK
jgi:oligoendopeptidase F